jgi:alpha-glucuronidase
MTMMKFPFIVFIYLLIICSVLSCKKEKTGTDDGYELWMKYSAISDSNMLNKYHQNISSVIVKGESETCRIIREELQLGLNKLLGRNISILRDSLQNGSIVISIPENSDIISGLNYTPILDTLGREGFLIKSDIFNKNNVIVITANGDIGLLYGTFHLLRLIQTRADIDALHVISKPRIQYRLLNHWDNLDGTAERGYAGKSLWKWDELPDKIDMRYHDYARANASIGINGIVPNNVNANPEILREKYLKKVSKLADLFRPYGIKVFLSINFSSPVSSRFTLNNRRGGIGNLETSDPFDPDVRKWWINKVKEIYHHIPDFGGFVVKANSEDMPGPQDYNRTHADGANMLAEMLEPYGGIVMWRAFVYNEEVDPDRAKRSYLEFVHLDGKFYPNVFIQGKNGPIDFQPREPVSPLFGATPLTPLMPELQITQEYLGHSTHLVYLAPMWKEFLEFDTFARAEGSTIARIIDGNLFQSPATGIAGVSNIGSDRNWCGHIFAQANWYAFGRLAWDHTRSAEEIAIDWIRMTISNDDGIVSTIRSMMMGSWEACVNYMTPLGLHHIMQPGFHYGPGPDHARNRRRDWTSVYYHRADSTGLGFDRSSSGSNAVSQYFSPLREQFNDINTCPEKYLLWFHHVNWNHRMRSGRSLWEELCYKYYSGTEYVDRMIGSWNSLENKLDRMLFLHVKNKLEKQKKDAVIWRDTCLQYFQKFSKKPVVHF